MGVAGVARAPLWRDSDSVTVPLAFCWWSCCVDLLVFFQEFMNSLRTAVRRFSTMALPTTTCSPFTQAVVSSMQKLYVISDVGSFP